MPLRRPFAVAALALAAAACLATPAAAQAPRGAIPPPLPLETLTVAKLAPAGPKRIYLSDVALPHIVDGKLHVVDGDTMSYRGLFATGYAGQSTLSADRRRLYVATSYYTRLSRGERTDVLDVYDTATLAHDHEIVIPPKHAQALSYRGLIAVSADDRWVFVQNATPAVSVSVVDTKARKFVQEIDTPGCWTILPIRSRPDAFATLCGDGTMLTVTLSADGSASTLERSAKLFDLEKDPLFTHAEPDGDTLWYVSFRGVLVGNMGYTPAEASQAIASSKLDAVAFGTSFLANPDLPKRIATYAALTAPNPATFYTPGPVGYTDYPSLG